MSWIAEPLVIGIEARTETLAEHAELAKVGKVGKGLKDSKSDSVNYCPQ
jgi:hypothetical protein